MNVPQHLLLDGDAAVRGGSGESGMGLFRADFLIILLRRSGLACV